MGHATPGMSSEYTERIGHGRLLRIANHVRAWLFSTDNTNGTPQSPSPESIENESNIIANERRSKETAPALKLYAG
jgi:hypothetical protein